VPRSLVSVVSASKYGSYGRCVCAYLKVLFATHTRTLQIIELPLLSPELFQRVGIKPPKGVLLYGPPGTGKTLLARAVAATLETNFLKVVSSAIVDKYIGESARVVREMFGYAREHEPCVIFMDEIDAIGGRRFSEGTSADREIQRTLMEVRTAQVNLRRARLICARFSC
jgi:ATP-dependent 26S proteasome regulatory subunit